MKSVTRSKTSLMILVLTFSLLAAAGVRAQEPNRSFATLPQAWLDLGSGMGYFSWVYLMPGIGAKTNAALYKSTYTELADKNPGNSIFNAQLAADMTRRNAEQRLRDTLGQLREHDPEFFDHAMEENGLALLNN